MFHGPPTFGRHVRDHEAEISKGCDTDSKRKNLTIKNTFILQMHFIVRLRVTTPSWRGRPHRGEFLLFAISQKIMGRNK